MAAKLFDEATERGSVRVGIGERALADEIRDLAASMFGITALAENASCAAGTAVGRRLVVLFSPVGTMGHQILMMAVRL